MTNGKHFCVSMATLNILILFPAPYS